MELIDKDALVEEIERLQNAIKSTAIDDRISKEQAEAYKVCVKLKSFIEDTLEVKEVDLKKEIDKIWKPRFSLGWDDKSLLSVSYEGFEIIAKHFFELGLKAQKGK